MYTDGIQVPVVGCAERGSLRSPWREVPDLNGGDGKCHRAAAKVQAATGDE